MSKSSSLAAGERRQRGSDSQILNRKLSLPPPTAISQYLTPPRHFQINSTVSVKTVLAVRMQFQDRFPSSTLLN